MIQEAHDRSVESGTSPVARYWAATLFLTLFAIFYAAQPMDIAFSSHEEPDVAGNIQSVQEGALGRRVGLLALAAIGAVAIAKQKGDPLKMQGAASYAVVGFLCWSAASVIWADDPLMTLRKLAALACLATGALGLAKLLSRQQLAALAFFSGGALLLLGLAGEIALRTFLPWQGEYRFAGLTNPAFTAWGLSLLPLAWAALRTQRQWWPRARDTLMLLAVAGIVLTKTRVSVAAFVAGAAVYTILVWPPRRTIVVMIYGGLAAAAFCLAAMLMGHSPLRAIGDIANLGREKESIDDLTGRTEVWQNLYPYIKSQRWQGYGYESFWLPSRLQEFGDEQKWAVPDAHNGFINLTLGTGLVGVSLYTLLLTLAFLQAARLQLRRHDTAYAFMAGVVVVEAVNMLGVATQLAPYLPSFLTMVVIARLAFVEDVDENPPVP
jgi:exopolysaccharide production protein ExoQ